MKPILTFFLLIVFLLTEGKQLAHAGASPHDCKVSGIKKLQEIAVQRDHQNSLRAANTNSQHQEELLTLVADEDDEQDDISRKNFSQSIGFTAFFYAFISNYSGNNTIDRHCFYTLPFYAASCKYIEQRSIRI